MSNERKKIYKIINTLNYDNAWHYQKNSKFLIPKMIPEFFWNQPILKKNEREIMHFSQVRNLQCQQAPV